MLVSPATIAALRADYTDVSPTRESPDPRLVALLDSYEKLRALRDAVTALLPDLTDEGGAGFADRCVICDGSDGVDPKHTDDCTAAALRVAYRAVSPRRVPGRPAGQQIAEEPTAEAREVLGLDRRRLYASDAEDNHEEPWGAYSADAGTDPAALAQEYAEEANLDVGDHVYVIEASEGRTADTKDPEADGWPLDVHRTWRFVVTVATDDVTTVEGVPRG